MSHSLPVVREPFPTITILQQRDTFVLCDEPTLTRQGHQPHGLHQGPFDESGEMCDTRVVSLPQRSSVLHLLILAFI